MLTAIRTRVVDDRGLTMVELLVALFLSALIGGAVVNSMSQATRAAQRSQNRITALAELQLAAHRMSRELRAANPITLAQANLVEVQVVRVSQTRTLRYALTTSGSTFNLQELNTVGGVTTTTVLARGLPAGGMALEYFDGSFTQIAAPVSATEISLIRTIKVTLNRFIPQNTKPITFQTTVDVRNQA